MDLDDFDDLPNGWHDAELIDVSFFPMRDELRLRISAWVGDLEAADTDTRERRRPCTMIITGIGWFSIHPGSLSRGVAMIDIGRGAAPGIDVPDAPLGTTMWWIYLQNRNSFLHVAGKTAHLADDEHDDVTTNARS